LACAIVYDGIDMPTLKSGRSIAVLPHSFVENVTVGSDSSVYAFIVAYRLSVQRADQLLELLPVLYFREGEGSPPNAPTYPSGFLVGDVLAGKAGWALEEIEEFRAWLDTDKAMNKWVADDFIATNIAIQDSPIWKSAFVLDD
jgi:hypothetical protein